MEVLRRGTRRRKLVRLWQTFLLGQGFYQGPVDGAFGAKTDAATRLYQERRQLDVDGVVGNNTLGRAMAEGLVLLPSITPEDDERGPNWPPRPTGLRPLGAAGRERLFGRIAYEPAPTATNPERIRITNDWTRHIRRVTVPQLTSVAHAPMSGRVAVHEAAADRLTELFVAWEDAALMPLVISWAGSYVPRFIRGSRTTLSNHAYGTAFDINAAWNPLGARPPVVGAEGSVRKLVPIANDLGWFWGGHYSSRPDGMHFELVKP